MQPARGDIRRAALFSVAVLGTATSVGMAIRVLFSANYATRTFLLLLTGLSLLISG